ncbi:dienelactone hydrolase family protein [bacterium]|nr:dienelactone hydrolase family protein [bacterium]
MLSIGCREAAQTPPLIKTETLVYNYNDQTYEGFLAYDENNELPRPGVVIFHQWTGLTDYEKRRARELAELGYVAFAADLYGQGVRPEGPEEAGKQAGKFYADREMFRERVNLGLSQLRKQPFVDKEHVAAIGYCFGGTAALELGRSGAELSGLVSFHGGLANPNPDDAKNFRCPVLVQHGADDSMVNPEVEGFLKEMDEADADYIFVEFANAVHAFTQPMAGDDPSTGVAYNKKADKRSWMFMQDFFDEIFGETVTDM